jgi:hypothetical protein
MAKGGKRPGAGRPAGSKTVPQFRDYVSDAERKKFVEFILDSYMGDITPCRLAWRPAVRPRRVSIIPCEKGADSVDFGIKHVQGLRISYTRSSLNLHREYESYAWKVTKDGENAGIEDPKCANHVMSAARYALTMFAGKDSMYDPEKRRRDDVEVSVTRRRLTENGAR